MAARNGVQARPLLRVRLIVSAFSQHMFLKMSEKLAESNVCKTGSCEPTGQDLCDAQ